ncbi:MAG TPA: hypothetical protein VKV80_19195 [Streptosporangiaceae bacterium]|nr:hypothetical protein [Streptosporangiaceae bacterium]
MSISAERCAVAALVGESLPAGRRRSRRASGAPGGPAALPAASSLIRCGQTAPGHASRLPGFRISRRTPGGRRDARLATMPRQPHDARWLREEDVREGLAA